MGTVIVDLSMSLDGYIAGPNNGGVAGRARAHSIATPFNDRVVELVHAMEHGERAPAPDELTQLVAFAGP